MLPPALDGFASLSRKELEMARRMQRKLIPSSQTLQKEEQQHSLHIRHASAPCEILGGDFWGCRSISDEELALYICDFSGHGLSSAINTFRIHALLEYQITNWGADPAYFVTQINEQMHGLLEVEQFATMFYGILHTGLDMISYVGAGAPKPLILRRDGSAEWLDSSGLPIGISGHYDYPVRDTSFYPGDLLILYSDSLVEQEGLDGKPLLTEESLLENLRLALKDAPDTAAKADRALKAVLQPFLNEVGGIIAMEDDLTLSVFYRAP